MKIRSRDIPAPRATRWAGIVFGLRYGAPLIALGVAVDLLLLLLNAR